MTTITRLGTLTIILCLFATGCSGLFKDLDDLQSTGEQNHVIVEEIRVIVLEQPPATIAVGDPFEVTFALVDEQGERTARENIELQITLSHGQFADGDGSIISQTNSSGTLRLDLAIEVLASGITLEATSLHPDLLGQSVTTDSFDVIAAAPSTDLSSITGESGLFADGESIAAITIHLIDPFGNPVSGVTPEFTASGADNHIQPCGATDETGVATCGLSTSQHGAWELSITSPISALGESIVFLPTCDPEHLQFGGGAGDAEDPWRICSPAQLQNIGTHLEDHFLLLADLVLSGEGFMPIGNDAQRFQGHFDASFHGIAFSISNLRIDTSSGNAGLFSVVDNTSTVQNVTLFDVVVTGDHTVGGLVGWNYGAVRYSCAHGSVDGRLSVGGLVGRNVGSVTDSCSSGSVNASQRSAGGLIGYNEGDILRSHSSSSVWDAENVGGLVGNNVTGTIADSFANGTVQGTEKVGGLVGANAFGSTISRSYADGNVEGHEPVGGLVGENYGQLYDTYSTSSVQGTQKVGGLVGENGVRRTTNPDSGSDIYDSYAAGSVDAEDDGADGLAGRHSDDAGEVLRCYYDRITTGFDNTNSAGNPRDTTVFAEQTEFDWDFDTIWVIGIAPDGATRPIFQWQVE